MTRRKPESYYLAKYPGLVVPGTLRMRTSGRHANKQTVLVRCQAEGCDLEFERATSDLHHRSQFCSIHKPRRSNAPKSRRERSSNGIDLARILNQDKGHEDRLAAFDTYICADYSGVEGDSQIHPSIVVARASRRIPPQLVSRSFSRQSLRSWLAEQLQREKPGRNRIIFAIDHQYSWPMRLWKLAALESYPWRESVRRLASPDGRRPAIDHPASFCARFNEFVGATVFSAPLPKPAKRYGIPRIGPRIALEDRFRLTELAHPLEPGVSAQKARPSPADCVGGQGLGAVGGQTLCGLKQLSQLIVFEDVAFWPYDGLDLRSPVYEGKHVGVEIYPTAVRPRDVKQTDANDALFGCWYLWHNDRTGRLPKVVDLSPLPQHAHAQVQKEGWVVGMTPTG